MSGVASAQDEVTGQLWTDYHAHFYHSESMEYYADGGIRFGGGDDKFVRAYVRPSIRYHHSEKLRFLAGLGVFGTNYEVAPSTLEIRPWQGVRFRWPKLGRFQFSNLVRLEQRLTFSENDSAFQLRLRYQLGTTLPLMAVPWRGFYVPVSFEFFFDAGDNVDLFSDELRLNAGVGYVVNEVWIFTFLLTVERTRSEQDSSFSTADIIFRFQVKQLLSKRDFRGRIEAPDS